MKKVSLDIESGSINYFGHKTDINLHARNDIKIGRFLGSGTTIYGSLRIECNSWDLSIFINDPNQARKMADELTTIANHIEDNNV